MVTPPTDWDSGAHALWTSNQQQAAFDAVLAKLNAHPPPMHRGYGLQFAYYLALVPDWPMAAKVMTELARAHPEDREIRKNLAACRSRAGDSLGAIQVYTDYVKDWPDDFDAWDGLANAYSATGQRELAREAGEHSLTLKDAQAALSADRHWRLPHLSIADHLAERPQRVITFSLWGNHPRYLRGALRNALLAPDLMPGWRCRFYMDISVPEELVTALADLGAEIIMETAPEVLTSRERLARRFWVANDPHVGRFLVRDTDSVLSLREAHAVHAWEASDRWFHVMRDWWTHTDTMLAGMWGGVAGVLPDLRDLFAHYNGNHMETPNWDQWFLRDRVWPFARQSCLIHDRFFEALGAQAWPGPAPTGADHVGQDEYAAHRERQARSLSAWIDRLTCLQTQG